MNTLNPIKSPFLSGTESRSTTNNNSNGIISKLFGRSSNNPLAQSSKNASNSNQSQTSNITGSRAEASIGRGADSQQGQSQVNVAQANENLAQNSQVQGNTKEGGCSCGGGCAGGCGCGCS